MLKIYQLIGDIRCVEITATVTPARRIEHLEGWIGAHIRNMLLAACSRVECDGDSLSLMDRINLFTLTDVNHPWHKQLKGGFPKGYAIKILSETKRGYEQTIKEGEEIRFSVTLIGQLCEYQQQMIQAIEIFAEKGIHGRMDMEINSVKQHSLIELLYNKYESNRLTIDYVTPISLFNNIRSARDNSPNSIQSKMNGFISIYQLVVSAVNRLTKMAILYGNCNASVEEIASATEQIAQIASNAELRSCNLHHTVLTTAKRRATKDKMVFDGLIGNSQWQGSEDITQLYPLLKFCSYISLGDNVVYGMGHYNISADTAE